MIWLSFTGSFLSISRDCVCRFVIFWSFGKQNVETYAGEQKKFVATTMVFGAIKS